MMERQIHTIAPVWNRDSERLILGSFPSVKSREAAFFYGNPQNRFWRVLAAVLGSAVPDSAERKCKMLFDHHIALWDVIASCEIAGSSDSSIRNVVPNDLSPILTGAPIRRIYCNGGTAGRLYKKFLQPQTGMEAVILPSTSPANAGMKEAQLVETWRILL